MTVQQLLASTDSRELQEWSVFLSAEAERQEAAERSARLQRELDGG